MKPWPHSPLDDHGSNRSLSRGLQHCGSEGNTYLNAYTTMGFGELLEQVGSTGRFQILQTTLLCIPVMLMASHNLLQNFVALVPPHFCSAHTNLSQSQMSAEEALLVTVPLDQTGKPERCLRYAAPQWHLLTKNRSSSSGKDGDTNAGLDVDLQGCSDGWTYNMTHMESTIISDVGLKIFFFAHWNLVCDQRSLKQMGQTIYMGGVLLGSVVFGGLSDRYGRRILLLISHLLMAVSGTFLEWIPTSVRTTVGTMTGYCYTVGQLMLALIAYFIRDWRWLTLAVSLPFFVFFLIAW
ncbi:hypothetical protein F7725_006600 [Dissostichus mawsoni]|uniref:Major facilitator superfamily (MFS) profile domain-containing protein n=1 Tax=Dissostichus mawsoni TaxID=36200 RepID=A0A7J5XX65_DISMA|nr:hypothetical protein F7725_006600 [Dissostichus mawsoni]